MLGLSSVMLRLPAWMVSGLQRQCETWGQGLEWVADSKWLSACGPGVLIVFSREPKKGFAKNGLQDFYKIVCVSTMSLLVVLQIDM